MPGSRILFIDRDGTLIRETDDERIDRLDKVEWLPGVFRWLEQIQREFGFRLVLVSNQDGLGRAEFPEQAFQVVHDWVIRTLFHQGIRFDAEHIDRSYPEDGLDTRKPGIGMLHTYLDSSVDLARSWVIGDRYTDILLARNLGTGAFWLPPHRGNRQELSDLSVGEYAVEDWQGIYTVLQKLYADSGSD